MIASSRPRMNLLEIRHRHPCKYSKVIKNWIKMSILLKYLSKKSTGRNIIMEKDKSENPMQLSGKVPKVIPKWMQHFHPFF